MTWTVNTPAICHTPFIVAKRGHSHVKMDILFSSNAFAAASTFVTLEKRSMEKSEGGNSTKFQYGLRDEIDRTSSKISSLHIVLKSSHIITFNEYVPRCAT